MDNQVALKAPVIPITRDLTPAYVWKTGRTIFLSKKERIVADAFIATRNYEECSQALMKEGWRKSRQTCRRWLEKSHIQDYLKEKFDEAGVYSGWTKEHWFKVMTDHLMGRERLANGDLYGMALIGKYKGWETPAVTQIGEINIVQANGRS